MKKHFYEEFVRVDETFNKDKLDFYGEASPLSTEEQKEFLKEYAAYHKIRFGADASYAKAVEKAEIENCKEKLGLEGQSNLSWIAYKRKMPNLYKAWQFYTDRTVLQEDTVVLKDSYAWPVPCAKYEFSGEALEEFCLSVKISKQYKAPVYGGVLSTTTGRYIEFRAGCKEIIKLYFSPNGYFIYKDSTVNAYRYTSNVIGKYEFDEWNEIKITRTSKGFILDFNEVAQEFERDLSGIDNLFLGGGMQPVDYWCVKPIYFKSDKRVVESFFALDDSRQEDVCLGEAKLPFVLGTEKNKDYALVLKSVINCRKDKIYKLDVDALDPGGEIFINGKSVARKDDFQSFSLDVTGFVQEGQNDLEVVVFPRAPESLFNWHKHNDYYNAWFCQGLHLIESEVYSEATLEVETKRVGEKTAFDVIVKNIEFYAPQSKEDVSYKISLQKKYPTVGEKNVLFEGMLVGDIIYKNFLQKVELWEVENPNLYEVFVEFYRAGKKIYELSAQTGFRTITQKNGELYLNGNKIVLKGALTMQFLPPYEDVPLNHICPTEEQIIQQALMIKAMNGNCLRLHQLGYGTSDKRFAMVCDRLGVLLIWTTRLIDSAENMQWTDDWKQAEDYKKQIIKVKNHPSIIIWEGSNEGHFVPHLIDKIYDNFVTAVKSVDKTRLLCPVSHLYYSWGDEGEKCGYYTNDGTRDEMGNAVNSSFGWKDELVVRSAHPYGILLGYGQPWQHMVTQCYKFQDDLPIAQDKAYLVSEFAIIGRQNPNTPEAQEFINKDSYELVDEFNALGFNFTDEEWELSQAFQALCTAVATKQLRKLNVDGMLWCCLSGGANNASYLKPIIDFYGYKKLAYYQLKEAFNEVTAFNENPDVLFDSGYKLRPLVVGANKEKQYSLTVEIRKGQEVVVTKDFNKPEWIEGNLSFEEWTPKLASGYYTICYIVTEQ